MEITEGQIYEAMGLEQPVEETQPATQEPEGQATQEESQPTGQDPEGQATQEEGQPTTQEEPEGQGGEGEPQEKMSLEERRENAARRRREETQTAIQEAVTQERERMQRELDSAVTREREAGEKLLQEVFSRAGIKDTTTGEPITTMEGFRAWVKKYQDAKLQQELKAGKLTKEGLMAAIREAQGRAEEAKAGTAQSSQGTVGAADHQGQQPVQDQAQAQAQTKPAPNPAMQAQVERELAEIRKLDPSIQKIGDLLTMPKAKEFAQLVRRGNSFLDAYKLAHYEELTQRTAQAARQQAMSNARSKGHLNATNPQGKGAPTVPQDQLEMFRTFNPGASEAEIQAYFNKYQGG